MTDFGRRGGDMFRAVYDPGNLGYVWNSALFDQRTLAQVRSHSPIAHAHAQADVINLATALAAKAALSHAHAQADVTNLVTALAAKAALSHTHTEAQITDLDHNALKIKGVEVDDTDKGDTKVLAYNSTSQKLEYETPTGGGPGNAIIGDATPGRVLRLGRFFIGDGTDSDTIKCQLFDRWNSDTIPLQDNLHMNETLGVFTLSSGGITLAIAAAAFTGNVVFALPTIQGNSTSQDITPDAHMVAAGITFEFPNVPGGTKQNITALTNSGTLQYQILYLTDA